MLKELGQYFCLALLDYSEPDQLKAKQALREIESAFNKS
jgi:protein-tyrosine phosphatase